MKQLLFSGLILISIFSFSQSTVDTAWTKVIGGSLDEAPGYGVEMRSNIDVNENGDIFIFFSTLSNDNYISTNLGERDLFLSKLSPYGDTVWTRIIGGSDWDIALDVLATNDGGCFIAGYTYSKDFDMESHNDSGAGHDAFVAKYDESGTQTWLQTYGGTEFLGITSIDKVNAISLLSNGNILAVGQTNSQNGDLSSQFNLETFYVGMVIEINSSNGDVENIKKLWWTTHDEYNLDQISKGFELQEGDGFIFFGESLYSPFGVDKLWVAKTDANFNIEWQKEFGSASYNIGYTAVMKNNILTIASAVQTPDGDFSGDVYGASDVWVGSLDLEGNIIKQNIIGGSEGEMIFDMIPTYQGYVLAGFTNSTDFYGSGDNSTVSDFWLLHLDDNLDTINTPYKNGGTDSDVLTGLAYSNGKLVVTGRTSSTDSLIYHNYGGRDIWVAELTDLISNTENVTENHDLKIYPNPNSGNFILCTNKDDYKFEIYNYNGQLVLSQKISSSNQLIDISQQSQGLYFIKVYGLNSVRNVKFCIL
jgi:hypothetical protein